MGHGLAELLLRRALCAAMANAATIPLEAPAQSAAKTPSAGTDLKLDVPADVMVALVGFNVNANSIGRVQIMGPDGR